MECLIFFLGRKENLTILHEKFTVLLEIIRDYFIVFCVCLSKKITFKIVNFTFFYKKYYIQIVIE